MLEKNIHCVNQRIEAKNRKNSAQFAILRNRTLIYVYILYYVIDLHKVSVEVRKSFHFYRFARLRRINSHVCEEALNVRNKYEMPKGAECIDFHVLASLCTNVDFLTH